MRVRGTAGAVVLMVVAATLVFFFFQRQMSDAPLAFGVPPEVLGQLEDGLGDLRRLATLDAGDADRYRDRFEALERTVQRQRVLAHNRQALNRRYELLLILIVAGSVVLATGLYAYRQSRHAPRLEKLRRALTDLADGGQELQVGVGGRDAIGRIAAMIEETSRAMARDRRRLATLRNLSAWQEAARRHAHEMRTPLTGARLELGRILDLADDPAAEVPAVAAAGEQKAKPCVEIRRAASEALDELERLGQFTRQFTSFARLPRPQLKRLDLSRLLEEFVTTYRGAWPNLEIELEAEPGAEAAVDRDMLRQVLVNLCENSSQALGDAAGAVVLRLSSGSAGAEAGSETDRKANRHPADVRKRSLRAVVLEVADDGPGIAESVLDRLFEPYSTTRTVGEGMGLGLAICKKILLDHGGDLELVSSSTDGTVFRLTLMRPGVEGSPVPPATEIQER